MAKPFRCNTYKKRGGPLTIPRCCRHQSQSLPALSVTGACEPAGMYLSILSFQLSTVDCQPPMHRLLTPPSVPLQPNALGATIGIGTRNLRDPGKQLLSPRCLRLQRGHREQSDDVPGHPGSVGVASRAWVQRSKVGPQQGGPSNPSVQDGEFFTASGKDADKCRAGKACSVRLG